MKSQIQSGKEFIHIDFENVWRYIPANRPLKEHLKRVLFLSMPIAFKRLEVYQNWKNARLFEDKLIGFRSMEFWKRKLRQSYHINYKNDSYNSYNKEDQVIKFAVVIHAFYPDVLQDILSKLHESETLNFKLFVTTSDWTYQEVDVILLQSKFEYFLMKVENRGRDILPFLKVLRVVFSEGYNVILKLHTKRSNHLKKRELWSDDLFNKMLGYENMKNILQTFRQNQQLGMIGPSEHILPMAYYYGSNASTVKMLGNRMGLNDKQFSNLHFSAGTMFYARKEALQPILDLDLKDSDFEVEAGQLDGTMAHAVERAFACSVIEAGMYLADSSSYADFVTCKISLNHSFSI